MRSFNTFGMVTLLSLISAGPTPASAATLNIEFKDPDHFRDMPRSDSDKARVLKEVGQHFEKLAKTLPESDTLTVNVLDFDMAGDVRPNVRTGTDIRVLRGRADWPSMTIRYSLIRNGAPIASGENAIDDKDYFGHINKYSNTETLRYEKAMIDVWFSKNLQNYTVTN